LAAFCKAVQNDEVVGPLRRGFKTNVWESKHKLLREDDKDNNLLTAGLLIHKKGNAIRSQLKVTFSEVSNATTKLRSFVAVANHNFCVLQARTAEILNMQVANTGMVILTDLVASKLMLPISTEKFTPDEIISAVVDGIQMPIKAVLENSPSLSGNPRFNDMNWYHVVEDFNLGILYTHLESIWDDCLWNDYFVTQVKEGNVFTLKDPIWQYRLVASRFRNDNLSMQFFQLAALTYRTRMRTAALNAQMNVRDVKSITKRGHKQVIQLKALAEPSTEYLALFSAQCYASEPY